MKRTVIVYLVRHADALAQEPDHSRPLSPKGEESARRVAEWLARCSLDVPQRVYHSGLLRAEQTARILAEVCAWPAPTATRQLGPTDDPEYWVERLARAREPLALVGHMPMLGALAASLLTGDPDGAVLQLKKMSVAALEREDEEWSLRWLIRPALIPSPASVHT
ncbi:MAG: phosphohistidine phosphatase SixA [bacterium]|nr:phosphohistidine phosphatase SixA [bacterium]